MNAKSKQLFAVSLCLTALTLVCPRKSSAQEPLAPLTRDELIDICLRPVFKENPDRVLNDFVRRNKIAFLPTKRTVEYLNSNGVPKLITDELKHNFASHIVFRVCQFEPVSGQGGQFTRILNRILETERILVQAKVSGLLRDKTFEPVPAEPTGPTRQELEQHPHSGYVLILGDVENSRQNPNRKTVTARLAFVSRAQERMSIATPLVREMEASFSSQEEVARIIARWSIEEVERQIQ